MSLKLPPAFAKGGDNYLMQTIFLYCEYNILIASEASVYGNAYAWIYEKVAKINTESSYTKARKTFVTGPHKSAKFCDELKLNNRNVDKMYQLC